uniref:Plectin/eS10 N-terminal domain-containing protein n=1 Tax=Anopheles culicifacies TaxID=139723 RepID=A0A182MPZ6_9DIPT
MQISKEQRKAIYLLLFQDGVMVAQKTHQPKMHRELKLIPNLCVIKTMKSLVSMHYVKECFSWNHYYWTLTNDGIIYLRDYLHLRPELVPTTLINRPRALPQIVSCDGKQSTSPKTRTDENRAVYRRPEREAGSSSKRNDAGAGTNELVFRGGFQRGNRNDQH